MLRIILLCLSLLPGGLWAAGGDFTIDASVDKDKVELGEALRFTLRLHVNGSLDFPPQMEQPKFDDFNAQGPQQGSNVTWVNGQVSMDYSWTWELVPMKAGTLTLGPYVAKAKDAKAGEIVRSTKAISLQVRRPKKLAFNLPEPGAQPPPPPPEPGADELRDIKPDRGLGWPFWAALLGSLAALVSFAAWWLLWRKPLPKAEPKPRDPGQHALHELEMARQECGPGGEAVYVRRAATVLRAFLRHRLDLRHEATLAEALRSALTRASGERRQEVLDLRLRLELLLYGDVKPEPADVEDLHPRLRELIMEIEENATRPLGAPAKAGPRARSKKRG